LPAALTGLLAVGFRVVNDAAMDVAEAEATLD
jgi:hypothetical protein